MTLTSPPERKEFKTDKEFEKAYKDWKKLFDHAMKHRRYGKYI